MTRAHPEPYQRLRQAARRIFDAALGAAEPGRLTRKLLAVKDRTLIIDNVPFPLEETARVIVLAAGKAAAPMSRAALEILGPLAADGLTVVRDLQEEPPGGLPLLVAGHPVPDTRSSTAAQRMLSLARSAGPGDLVLALFSGGASALLSAPAPPLDLEQLRGTTALLINSGAGIHQINCVRKHLSAIKGGLLARAVQPAGLATLLLSDVVGDRPEVIASGPTVPDPTTYGQALRVLETRGLDRTVPAAVMLRLRRGAAGELDETPGPDDPCFADSIVRLVGSNRDALDGAAAEARNLGFTVEVRERPVTGEAREAATIFGNLAGSVTARDRNGLPVCFLSGGETTVTLPPDHGRGGRNMELALAAAPLLAKIPGTLLLSAGTDGSDGPTPAAGALADSRTMDRARQAGLDPESALLEHDSFHFFQALGGLVVTGPTGTNVMDLQILLSDPASAEK